jgi:hypothetical protein
MKNLIVLIVLALMSAPVFANDCASGVCRQPVRRTVSKVADVTSAIVVAPVRATKNFATNVRSRSLARRSHR